MDSDHFNDEIARRHRAVTAIRHVLKDVAAGRYAVPVRVRRGLEVALDSGLALYAACSDEERRA